MERLRDNQKMLIGAQKRKFGSYKKQESRASTPADSGFKESEAESNPSSEPESEASHTIQNNITKTERRMSARLRVIKIKKTEKRNNSTSEQLLKQTIKRKRLTKSRNGSWNDKELLRWTPKVVLKRLTKQQIARALDDWSFLNHIHILSEITFHCELVAQHNELDGSTRTLLRWTHPIYPLYRHEWIDRSNVPLNTTKTIDIQNLSWYEKLLLRPFIKY